MGYADVVRELDEAYRKRTANLHMKSYCVKCGVPLKVHNHTEVCSKCVPHWRHRRNHVRPEA